MFTSVGFKTLKGWDEKLYEFYIEKTKSFTSSHPSLKQFVLDNHYLKSLPRGTQALYSFYYQGELCGVAAFGYPTGTYTIRKYGNVLELKRFVLNNDLPKNSESFLLSTCIQHLKKTQRIVGVISYADPSHGHEGVIYKATNFDIIGTQPYPTMGLLYRGKVYRGDILSKHTKPAMILKRAKKEGKTKFIRLPKKNVYLYNFKK